MKRIIFKTWIVLLLVLNNILTAQTNNVVFEWAGAVTDTSFLLNFKLISQSNQLKIIADTTPIFSSPIFSNTLLPDTSNNNIISGAISGLQPGTTYYYAITDSGIIIPNSLGNLKTAIYGTYSFSFAAGSCSSVGNHAVYDVINTKHPSFFIFTGDLHYFDPNSTDINAHRIPYSLTLSQPNIRNFLSQTPIAYMWDDHDFSGNNSDGTAIGKHSAYVAYRHCVPHYPLQFTGIDNAIYQSFEYGRCRFILSDLRSERIALQNIMSAQQLNWLKNEFILARNKKQLAIWVSSITFTGINQLDNWAEFASEREDISNFLRDSSIANLLILSGDAHMLAIDDGTNNHYTSGTQNQHQFPIFQAAALNRAGSVKGGIFSHGVYPNPTPQTGQFGLIDVTDNGADSICITLNGYRTDSVGANTTIVTSYSFCRNLVDDLITTKNITTDKQHPFCRYYYENNELVITNICSSVLKNVVIYNLQSQVVFRIDSLAIGQQIRVPNSIKHSLLLVTAISDDIKRIMKVVY